MKGGRGGRSQGHRIQARRVQAGAHRGWHPCLPQSWGWGGELEEAVSYSMHPIPPTGLAPSRLGLTWDRVVQGAVLISFDDNQREAAQDGFVQPPVITARPPSSPSPHNLHPTPLIPGSLAGFNAAQLKGHQQIKIVSDSRRAPTLRPPVSPMIRARQGCSRIHFHFIFQSVLSDPLPLCCLVSSTCHLNVPVSLPFLNLHRKGRTCVHLLPSSKGERQCLGWGNSFRGAPRGTV